MINPEQIPIFSRLRQIRDALPAGTPLYLVGGAVRDLLLGRTTHDLDFVLPADAIRAARRVANTLQAAFYPLDEERDTGRVVIIEPDGSREVLDFSVLRGPDLESDLRARDFTVNAIALDIHAPQTIIDPLGGAADLRAKLLRACTPASLLEDPLRILRGVRLAANFGFQILPDTTRQMRRAVQGLPRVSPERARDELFRLFSAPQPAASLRILDRLGVLPYLLPELDDLKGVEQSPPHVWDVWEHTLSVLQKLETLVKILQTQHDPEAAASLAMGLVSIRLGRYRERIAAHLDEQLIPGRSLRPLLYLAALYHDIAKPRTAQREEDGRIRFLRHEELGAEIAASRAHALRLSTLEIERVKKIVRYHMRPLLLTNESRLPSRRATYRFFRDAGPAGVDICLLSLADMLATYQTGLPQELWEKHLDVVRALLEAWWERPEESISPPPFLNGNDLIEAFGLAPGPQIGQLLEAIREAQAGGQVSTRAEALDLAGSLISHGKSM